MKRLKARASVSRVVHLVIVLWLVSLGTFMLLELTPGDPAVTILGDSATPQAIAELRAQLGLDLPLLSRYGSWIGGVLRGDFGVSLVAPGGSVASRIGEALPVSMQLAAMAVLMALVVAIPVAVWSAYRQGRVFDRFWSNASFGMMSLPTFVTGLLLGLVFALKIPIFPRAQWVRMETDLAGNLSHAFLPALCLALPLMAIYIRTLRAEMVQTLQDNSIEFAYAKGLPVRTVLFKYALRPSSLSLVTLSGVTLGSLVAGTVIVESIYALPGLGSLLVGAVGSNDFPLVQGVVLIIAVLYVLLNVIVDISYGFLDPRVRNVRS